MHHKEWHTLRHSSSSGGATTVVVVVVGGGGGGGCSVNMKYIHARCFCRSGCSNTQLAK
jgi:hypothetical protein